MYTNQRSDAYTIMIQLNELKSRFHRAIQTGEEMVVIRDLHTEIKELECHLTALQWSSNDIPERAAGGEQIRQRFAGENPPVH